MLEGKSFLDLFGALKLESYNNETKNNKESIGTR